ncbi:NAD(P)H-dependent oxidoreductase [Brevibacillus humidisoli]|uniref:NADPH-dependent FMN reductase n=1 Tax=Brevibacillus humidisoli TaxID=2895522 RepID=UPI001E3ECD34|nr:NADPH-dependent FMN reductase [Brevibacillus humidisoli]UFJ39706.1 NAD(P)H-dependent oxidoreductase [Brevibacillus humidisoli]
MNILVICGSATQQSRTRGLAKAVMAELQGVGVDVSYFDVGEHILPLYTGRDELNQQPEVQRLRRLAEQADGFYICTPEYHSAISGSLKNALDFLGWNHFSNKPVAISAVAGGGKGGINALNNLRLIVRAVYGLALPGQFVADPVHFNERSELVDEEALSRVKGLVGELVQMTERLTKAKA